MESPDGKALAAESSDAELARLIDEQNQSQAADRRGESEFNDESHVSLDELEPNTGSHPGGSPDGEPGRIPELDTNERRWDPEVMQSGNDFNKAQSGVYQAEELVLDNGKIVDGYDPGQQIVSRKRTQLAEISPTVAEGYVDELIDKYGPGRKVADTPGNRARYPQLIGQRLVGQMVLELSVQNAPIPFEVGARARRFGIVIRDFNGTVLN